MQKQIIERTYAEKIVTILDSIDKKMMYMSKMAGIL